MTSTSDHRSAREIEADLERERADLAETLDELQDRVSVDRMAREALGMIRSNAGSYARSLDSAVRANPLALAVTAAGLAWLMFGSGPSSRSLSGHARRGRADPVEDWYRDTPPAFSGMDLEESPYGTTGRPAYGQPRTADHPDDHGWSHRIDRMRAAARERVRRLEASARRRAGSMKSGAHHGYEGSRDFAAERASVLRDFVREMRTGFSHGLEGLSDGARERVIAARERAYSARLSAERMAREGGDYARDTYREHPLAMGAVAMAAGAAAAAALPRTRLEDRTFGAESDRMMEEAREMLQAERERAERVARGVGEELRETVSEMRDRATEAAREAKDHAAETSDRLRERAKDEAAKGGGPAATSAMARPGREPGIEDLPGRGPSSTVPGGDVAPAEEVPARPGFGPDVPGEDLPGDTVRGADWGSGRGSGSKGGAGSVGAPIGASETPKPGTTRGPKG